MGCSFPSCFDECYPCCIPGLEPSLGPLRGPEEMCLLMLCCLLCSVLPRSSSWLLLHCTLDLGWSPYLSVCYPEKTELEISLESTLWCLHRCTQRANRADIFHKSLPKVVPLRVVMKSGNGRCSETFNLVLVWFLQKQQGKAQWYSVLPAFFFMYCRSDPQFLIKFLTWLILKCCESLWLTMGKSWAKALMAMLWRLFSWRSR